MEKTSFDFEINEFKVPVLWREYLASVVNGLTNSSKISDLNKREIFELYQVRIMRKLDESALLGTSALFDTCKHVDR